MKELEEFKRVEIGEILFEKFVGSKPAREFSNRYEYCIIYNYENLYKNYQCNSIQIGDIFVTLLTTEGRSILVAYDFLKDRFTLESMINWLHRKKVQLITRSQINTIKRADRIIEALKFRHEPLILYTRGQNTLEFDRENMREITEEFIPQPIKINTYNSKIRHKMKEGMTIIFNDKHINDIPQIDLTSEDTLISNGNVIAADYIGDYKGHVAFYEKKNCDNPIAWFYDKNTQIYIDISKKAHGKGNLIVVQASYVVDIEIL